MLFNNLTFYKPLIIRFAVLNLHSNVFFGQQRLNHLGPLDEAEVATIEVVLIADIVGLFQLFNAIKIKMINRLAFLCDILVDDGERRAIHLVGDTHTVTQVFDEGGLARAHGAIEGDDIGLVTKGNQVIGDLGEGLDATYFERFIFHCK